MFPFLQKVALAGLAGVTALVLASGEARAQVLRPGVPGSTNPFFQTNPGLGSFPSTGMLNPTALGAFNNPLVNPYAFSNTGTLTSTPYQNSNPAVNDPNANPYSSPYANYGESPVGGFMRGTADIISAQGKWQVQTQQAYILKEQVRREKLENRRRIFDQYLYEREKTPTFEEERQRFLGQELLRSLNNPPVAEVWSAQALNNVLTDLNKMDKPKGPAIPLDEDILKHINLTSGGTLSPGILKYIKNDQDRLTWPLALREQEYKDERERLDQLVVDAIRQVINGRIRVEDNILKDLNSSVAKLRQKLTGNIKDLTPNQYIEASRFLGNVEDGLRVLSRPDAGDFFTKKFAAQGKTISDLVQYMNSKGLTFAPAVTGDEAAYIALHRALVLFDQGAKAQVATER